MRHDSCFPHRHTESLLREVLEHVVYLGVCLHDVKTSVRHEPAKPSASVNSHTWKSFFICPLLSLTLSLSCLPRRHSKSTNRSAKIETIKAFPPSSQEHFKRLLSKRTVLKVDLLKAHQICCLQACMRALFILENLRAGAVKELRN